MRNFITNLIGNFTAKFGQNPDYLIIGKKQAERLLRECLIKNKYFVTTTISEFMGVNVIIVKSDIIEVASKDNNLQILK